MKTIWYLHWPSPQISKIDHPPTHHDSRNARRISHQFYYLDEMQYFLFDDCNKIISISEAIKSIENQLKSLDEKSYRAIGNVTKQLHSCNQSQTEHSYHNCVRLKLVIKIYYRSPHSLDLGLLPHVRSNLSLVVGTCHVGAQTLSFYFGFCGEKKRSRR